MVFNCGVPNQRRPGQTFLGLQVSAELFKLVNEARKRLRLDRSRFVREAIAEKLRALGYEVPPSMVDPPDRADRGEAHVSSQPRAAGGQVAGGVDKRLAAEGYEIEQQHVGGAVLRIVSDPPGELRAAETPAASPAGPRKKTTYRKPKKR